MSREATKRYETIKHLGEGQVSVPRKNTEHLLGQKLIQESFAQVSAKVRLLKNSKSRV